MHSLFELQEQMRFNSQRKARALERRVLALRALYIYGTSFCPAYDFQEQIRKIEKFEFHFVWIGEGGVFFRISLTIDNHEISNSIL